MQSKHNWIWFALIPAAGLFVLLGGIFIFAVITPDTDTMGTLVEVELDSPPQADGKIALIRLEGTIVSSGPQGGVTGHALRSLKQAKADQDVSVVLLDVNTPGGSVTDSDLIYNRIKQVREAGKHVYVLFGDLCASGGYYLAVAAQEIWSRPTSITGSIGVIVPSFSMVELLSKVGIADQSVASGENKQILGATKAMTAEQRAIIESVVMEMYERFIGLVADGRDIELDKVRIIADGRLYSAEQAKKNGLVDEIGYRDDLIKKIGASHGQGLSLVEYRAPISLFDSLAGASASPSFERWFSGRIKLANRPAFLFSPLE